MRIQSKLGTLFSLFFKRTCSFTFRQADSVLFSFEAQVDGKRVVGVCKEKESAFQSFDDSISSGHGMKKGVSLVTVQGLTFSNRERLRTPSG